MHEMKRKKGRGSKPGTRSSTRTKYAAIQARFKELYIGQRKRMDDVEQMLCDEFYLSRSRVLLILKADLSRERPITHYPRKPRKG